MAAKLKKTEDSPGLMITSPAFRALETAIIFASEYGIKPEMISMKSDLYFKSNFHSLQGILTEAGDDNDSITLFGHNPAFTEIPTGLTRGGCDYVPKSGVVCISFKINKWSELKQNSGKLEYFLRPDK
jgi:phosphohistidine phosphatase